MDITHALAKEAFDFWKDAHLISDRFGCAQWEHYHDGGTGDIAEVLMMMPKDDIGSGLPQTTRIGSIFSSKTTDPSMNPNPSERCFTRRRESAFMGKASSSIRG